MILAIAIKLNYMKIKLKQVTLLKYYLVHDYEGAA